MSTWLIKTIHTQVMVHKESLPWIYEFACRRSDP